MAFLSTNPSGWNANTSFVVMNNDPPASGESFAPTIVRKSTNIPWAVHILERYVEVISILIEQLQHCLLHHSPPVLSLDLLLLPIEPSKRLWFIPRKKGGQSNSSTIKQSRSTWPSLLALRFSDIRFLYLVLRATPQVLYRFDLSIYSSLNVLPKFDYWTWKTFLCSSANESLQSCRLSGYFQGTFWSHCVQELGRDEPATRHAIFALSRMYEEDIFGAISTPVADAGGEDFAMESYNKAIRSLITHLNNPDQVRVGLTVCIIFICIACLRRDIPVALKHIDGGMKLLAVWRGKHAHLRSEFEIVERTLVSLARFDEYHCIW